MPSAEPPGPATRLARALRREIFLVVLFFSSWLTAIVLFLAGQPLAGTLPFGLYPFYSTAAAVGWLAGNLYVHRTRGLEGELRPAFRLIYFVGPPGLLYLVYCLLPRLLQQAVPFGWVYSLGVFTILFLVPVTFARSAPRRNR